MWDVIIVGGGPGGAIASKKCAEQNLKTLLLEKKRLPREKICSGIISPMAQSIVKQEFGEIPSEVLTSPQYLSGIRFHVSGVEDEQIGVKLHHTWRRDLDHWFVRKAQQAGVHVWEKTRVTHVTENPWGYLLKLNRENKETEVIGKFIIGADGATSIVRKCLFPQLKVYYQLGYRECYKINLGLDKHYLHFFTSPDLSPYFFDVISKGEFTLIEIGTKAKGLKTLVNQAYDILANNFGFERGSQPLWCDAGAIPILYRELLSGSFLPSKGNSLLVGDAAGFILPISGEGIRTALESGLWAAISVIEARKNNIKASDIYMGKLNGLLSRLGELSLCSRKLFEQKHEARWNLLLKEAWQKAIGLD